MKRRTVLVWSALIFVALAVGPFTALSLKLFQAPVLYALPDVNPAPVQGLSDWENVTLLTAFDYHDAVMVEWSGNPTNFSAPPFGPLFAWTMNGSIDAWIINGGTPASIIEVMAHNASYSAAQVEQFFNYTMDNIIGFDNASRDLIDFGLYTNQLNWTFTGNLTSTVGLLNQTIHLVSNGTRYLANAFDPLGIAANLTDCTVHMEWSTTQMGLQFFYRLANATATMDQVSYSFSMSRALGHTTPVFLNGTGTVVLLGPANYIILQASPASLFTNYTIPFSPTGPLFFSLSQEISYDFDVTIEFKQGGGFFIAALASFIATGLASLAGAIGIGYSGMAMIQTVARKPETFSKGMISVVLAEALSIYGLLVAFTLIMRIDPLMSFSEGIMAMASGLAIGLAAIGAGIGIARSGSALCESLAYRPEAFSKALVSVVLAEALSIYGLLAAFMIIMRIDPMVGLAEGIMAIASGLAIGFTAIGAGIGIASAGSALCSSLAYRPEAFSKALVSVVLAEAISIYGLLVSFIIIMRIGVSIPMATAWVAIGAALTVGIGGFFAGLAIGWGGASMTGSIERRPEVFSKAMVSVVLAEALAIYCLLVAFMLLMA